MHTCLNTPPVAAAAVAGGGSGDSCGANPTDRPTDRPTDQPTDDLVGGGGDGGVEGVRGGGLDEPHGAPRADPLRRHGMGQPARRRRGLVVGDPEQRPEAVQRQGARSRGLRGEGRGGGGGGGNSSTNTSVRVGQGDNALLSADPLARRSRTEALRVQVFMSLLPLPMTAPPSLVVLFRRYLGAGGEHGRAVGVAVAAHEEEQQRQGTGPQHLGFGLGLGLGLGSGPELEGRPRDCYRPAASTAAAAAGPLGEARGSNSCLEHLFLP